MLRPTRSAQSDYKHVGWCWIIALIPLMALALGGCSVFTASALPNNSSATSGNVPSHPVSVPHSSPVAVNLPVFTSAAALTAMQRWAAEVKRGRIVDGSAVRSPSNSGWIVSLHQVNNTFQQAPYGVLPAYMTSGDGPNGDGPVRQVTSVVGVILYVFAYRGAAGSASPAQTSYGLLLGSVNGADQPVTLLIWLSADTDILLGSHIAEWTNGIQIDVATYGFASDAAVASMVGNRLFASRTASVRFVTAFDSTVSGSPPAAADEPQSIKRNNAALALVTKSTTQQTETGVFTTLPSPGFTITPQEGLESPDSIRLSSEVAHNSVGILTS